MENVNLIQEAAKSRLGIVALLFIVASGLARAFFGKETPLKVRVTLFAVMLLGCSAFAVAV